MGCCEGPTWSYLEAQTPHTPKRNSVAMLVAGDVVDVDSTVRRYMGLIIGSERPTRRRRRNVMKRNANAIIEMIL